MTSGPAAELDAVVRLRILAAGLPHAVIAERVLDAPYERVRAVLSDLERCIPEVEWLVRSFTIVGREGDRLRAELRLPLGPVMRQEVELRPGWALVRAPYLESGLAAAPEPGGRRTRIAHFERVRGLGRAAAPLLRRKVGGDLERFAALVERAP